MVDASRRRVVRQNVVFLDDDRSRGDHALFNHGRWGDRRGNRPGHALDPGLSLLHRSDHVLADALLVERDDVGDRQFLLDAALLNLIDDDRLG